MEDMRARARARDETNMAVYSLIHKNSPSAIFDDIGAKLFRG